MAPFPALPTLTTRRCAWLAWGWSLPTPTGAQSFRALPLSPLRDPGAATPIRLGRRWRAVLGEGYFGYGQISQTYFARASERASICFFDQRSCSTICVLNCSRSFSPIHSRFSANGRFDNSLL